MSDEYKSNVISAAEFYAKHCAADCVLDLRTAAERNTEYLEGSLHLPVQDLVESSFASALGDVANDKPVYLLCQSGRRAVMAVEKLNGSTRELIIIDGGINALKVCGAELKQGQRQVISLERQVRIAAGFLVVLGVVLGALIAPVFYVVSAFVGCGLMYAGISDNCGMALVLSRMPWNKA